MLTKYIRDKLEPEVGMATRYTTNKILGFYIEYFALYQYSQCLVWDQKEESHVVRKLLIEKEQSATTTMHLVLKCVDNCNVNHSLKNVIVFPMYLIHAHEGSVDITVAICNDATIAMYPIEKYIDRCHGFLIVESGTWNTKNTNTFVQIFEPELSKEDGDQ